MGSSTICVKQICFVWVLLKQYFHCRWMSNQTDSLCVMSIICQTKQIGFAQVLLRQYFHWRYMSNQIDLHCVMSIICQTKRIGFARVLLAQYFHCRSKGLALRENYHIAYQVDWLCTSTPWSSRKANLFDLTCVRNV